MGGECRQRSTAARAWQMPAGFQCQVDYLAHQAAETHSLLTEPLFLATLRSTKRAPSPRGDGSPPHRVKRSPAAF